MNRIELIEKALENIDTSELVEVWNKYCAETCSCEYCINFMYDFDDRFYDLFSGMTPTDVIQKVQDSFSDFDVTDDYYVGDDEYCLESCTDVMSVIDTYELADYIDRHDESFGNDDIDEALHGYRDFVIRVLDNMALVDLVNVYNLYAERVNYNQIFFMENFNEDIGSTFTPRELSLRIYNGDFNPYDTYWFYDGNANLGSACDKCELPIDTEEIADYIVENKTDFGNPVLAEALSDVA